MRRLILRTVSVESNRAGQKHDGQRQGLNVGSSRYCVISLCITLKEYTNLDCVGCGGWWWEVDLSPPGQFSILSSTCPIWLIDSSIDAQHRFEMNEKG